jgi:hypothetical protein
VVDPVWAESAFRKFFATGANIRQQHRFDKPVGIGLEYRTDASGAVWLKSRIIDKKAQRLIKGGVLRDYSVGIGYPEIRRGAGDPPGGRITNGVLIEVSVVDRGSCPNTRFEICKATGGNAVYSGKLTVPKLTKVDKAVRRGDIEKAVKLQFPTMRKMLQDVVDFSRDTEQREWARMQLESLK